mmetsp:Transcript_38092/g.96297  ORF Transcript_38092/g.96297 Transcript_38092/m.96297 type:complete len:255 (-) Transcript_38092:142-906(-)
MLQSYCTRTPCSDVHVCNAPDVLGDAHMRLPQCCSLGCCLSPHGKRRVHLLERPQRLHHLDRSRLSGRQVARQALQLQPRGLKLGHALLVLGLSSNHALLQLLRLQHHVGRARLQRLDLVGGGCHNAVRVAQPAKCVAPQQPPRDWEAEECRGAHYCICLVWVGCCIAQPSFCSCHECVFNLMVHAACLLDGNVALVNITESYGIAGGGSIRCTSSSLHEALCSCCNALLYSLLCFTSSFLCFIKGAHVEQHGV